MMLGLRRINDVWLIEKRRVLVIQSHLRGVQQYSQWVVFRLGCSYPGRTGRNRDGKQGEDGGGVGVWLVRGERVLEGGCSAGPALPPSPPSSRSLRSSPGSSSVAFGTPAWAKRMDNRAVVAIPFVAGYWPCACHLCLCLELLWGIQGRVEVGWRSWERSPCSALPWWRKRPRSSPVPAQPGSVPGSDTGVPGRTQPRRPVTRRVTGTGPLASAQGQCLAGAALLLPVQKPDNLDLPLVWSLCSLACCRYAFRSCSYSFTAGFGFSLAGITTADKAKTLSYSCPEKWLWSRFSSGGLIQTRISTFCIRNFTFLWLIAGCSKQPSAARGARRRWGSAIRAPWKERASPPSVLQP